MVSSKGIGTMRNGNVERDCAGSGASHEGAVMTVLQLTLPWPPTVNTYYRNVNGKTLISEKGRQYRAAVADQVLIQRGAKMLEGRLAVAITAHVPDQRRRDLDNLLKSTLDALTHAGVWLDDQQIDSLSIERGPIGGMLRVKVQEVRRV